MNVKGFITQSVNWLRDQQGFNAQTWGLNSPGSSWDVDMEKGTITFLFPDKTVTASVQIIGTLYDGSFMWGWEHPSVLVQLQHDALLAKEWGEKNNLEDYTNHVVKADEDKAWEFTAVANRLSKATGTYRGKTDDTWVYMTFGPVKMIGR